LTRDRNRDALAGLHVEHFGIRAGEAEQAAERSGTLCEDAKEVGNDTELLEHAVEQRLGVGRSLVAGRNSEAGHGTSPSALALIAIRPTQLCYFKK
jgi:hypothetical protein